MNDPELSRRNDTKHPAGRVSKVLGRNEGPTRLREYEPTHKNLDRPDSLRVRRLCRVARVAPHDDLRRSEGSLGNPSGNLLVKIEQTTLCWVAEEQT